MLVERSQFDFPRPEAFPGFFNSKTFVFVFLVPIKNRFITKLLRKLEEWAPKKLCSGNGSRMYKKPKKKKLRKVMALLLMKSEEEPGWFLWKRFSGAFPPVKVMGKNLLRFWDFRYYKISTTFPFSLFTLISPGYWSILRYREIEKEEEKCQVKIGFLQKGSFNAFISVEILFFTIKMFSPWNLGLFHSSATF